MHIKIDKALACHTGVQVQNLDTTQDFSAPILSGIPAMCTISLPMAWSNHGNRGEIKERNHGNKSLGAQFVRQTHIWERCKGERGLKIFLQLPSCGINGEAIRHLQFFYAWQSCFGRHQQPTPHVEMKAICRSLDLMTVNLFHALPWTLFQIQITQGTGSKPESAFKSRHQNSTSQS